MTGWQGVGVGLAVGLGLGVPLGAACAPMARAWRKARRHVRVARYHTRRAAGWLALAVTAATAVLYLITTGGTP